jgi:hypothetical protein
LASKPEAATESETLFLLGLCAPARGLVPALPADPGAVGDWGLVLDLASRHKVTRLAYRALAEPGAPSVPEAFVAGLKKASATQAAVSSLLIAEWAKIAAAFDSAGVRALVVKGPGLALQLFNDPFSRDYRDIDLLVDLSSMETVVALLAARGFEPEKPFVAVPPRYWERSVEYRHLTFHKPGWPLHFEVHGAGRTSMRLPIGADEAFSRAELYSWEGTTFPTLGLEDQALLALVHAAKHAFCTLQWVFDCMVFAARPGFHSVSARGDGGVDPQYAEEAFGALAAKLFTGASLAPFHASRASGKRRAEALAEFAYARLLVAGADRQKPKVGRRFQGFYLRGLRRGFGAGAMYAFRVFRPTAREFAFLGGRLPLVFYWVLRFIHGVSRRAGGLLSRNGRDGG